MIIDTKDVTPQIQQHLSANYHLSKKQIMLNNFLGGLSWGFGTVIGATVVAAILIWFLGFFNFIPGINDLLNSPQVKGVHTTEK